MICPWPTIGPSGCDRETKDRVAPGRYRPGAPTDPYVRALAHTVPLIMDSLRDSKLSRTLILLSVSVSWTRLSNFDAFVVFLKNGSMNRRLAFLRWLQPGAVRQLHWYYRDAMTPCRHPAALRFLRLAVPRLHSLDSLPDGRVRRQGLELVTWCLRPGIRRGANRVLPSSWGTTIVRLRMFSSDAGRTARTRPLKCRSVAPRAPKCGGSHGFVFRRSVAWLSDSLSTLRSADYSYTTQDSLSVAGQALLDGLSTRTVPLKGFRVVTYISSSSPKLAWRNGRDRRWQRRKRDALLRHSDVLRA
jgi:hypothetical protein